MTVAPTGTPARVALAALLFACSSDSTARLFGLDAAPASSPAPADAAPPLPAVASRAPLSRASTDELWKLAPDSIQFGAVVADGGFESAGAGLAELGAALSADPEGARLWQAWTTRLRQAVGFDLHDLRRWRSVGLDPSRGGALFGTTGSEAAMVLPVGDTDSLRVVFQMTSREIDGVSVDVSRKLGYCLEVTGRYVCADTAELALAIAAGDTGALGRRALALPDELRGTIEVVADLSAFPGARRRLRDLEPALSAIGLLAVGVRLGGGRVELDAWLAGQRGGPIGDAFSTLGPARSLRRHLGGAVGVVAAHVPIGELWEFGEAPESVKIGASDLGELVFDRLTGQVALITGGRGLAAGTAVVGLDDASGLRRSIPEVCRLIGELSRRETRVSGDRCEAAIAPTATGLPVLPGLPPALRKPIPMTLEAADGRVVIATGDTSTSGPAPEFALEPAHALAWGRALDPLATAGLIEAKLMAAAIDSNLDPRSERRLAVLRRLLNHVYEVGVRGRLDADGARVSVELVTFAADPAPVYAAYKIAVDRLLGGDHAGYREQIAALGRKHPDTLAGSQAEMVAGEAPAVGPGTALFAAIALEATLKYIAR